MQNGGYYTVFNKVSEHSKKIVAANPPIARARITTLEQYKSLMEKSRAEAESGKRILSSEERGALLFQQHCREVYLFAVKAIASDANEAASRYPLASSYKFTQLVERSMLHPPLPFELPCLPELIRNRVKKDSTLWSLGLMGEAAIAFLQKYAEHMRSMASGIKNTLVRSSPQSSRPVFPDTDFFVVAESHYAHHIVFSEFLRKCSLLAGDQKEEGKVFLPPPAYMGIAKPNYS